MAEIVVRFLRERVTIAQGAGLPGVGAEAWQRQVTNERGFEAIYVAALLSVGGQRAWRRKDGLSSGRVLPGTPHPGRWLKGGSDLPWRRFGRPLFICISSYDPCALTWASLPWSDPR